MNLNLLLDAIYFAKNHSQINNTLIEREKDNKLVLIGVSCKKNLYEGGSKGFFLRVIFDFKIKNQRNTIGPDVFIDLEYDGEKFNALSPL